MGKYSMPRSSIAGYGDFKHENTIPDGSALSLTIDFLQRPCGLEFSGATATMNGVCRPRSLLLLAEFMNRAPILVPDARNMPTGDIPVVF
jgi:hypothetical protein